jgi:hypothetical protein
MNFGGFNKRERPMLSSQEEQIERREVQRNDQLVRQGSTFHQHGIASASDLAGGRWSGQGAAYVVGSRADIASAYPAASSAHQIQLPDELPTGYRIDDMEPLEQPPALPVAQGNLGEPTSDAAPSPIPLGDVERRDVGSPLSPDNLAAQGKSQMSSAGKPADVRPERSPVRRF